MPGVQSLSMPTCKHAGLESFVAQVESSKRMRRGLCSPKRVFKANVLTRRVHCEISTRFEKNKTKAQFCSHLLSVRRGAKSHRFKSISFPLHPRSQSPQRDSGKRIPRFGSSSSDCAQQQTPAKRTVPRTTDTSTLAVSDS